MKCAQEKFPANIQRDPIRDGAVLGLIQGDEARRVVEMVVEEHFSDSDHNMVQFKLVKDKEIGKLQKKQILDWGEVDFNKIRQVLAQDRLETATNGRIYRRAVGGIRKGNGDGASPACSLLGDR